MDVSLDRIAGPRLDAIPKLTRFHYLLMPVFIMGYWFEFANIASLGLVMPIISKNWALTQEEVGLVLASVSWGMIVGAYTGGMMADLFGRRRVFMLSLISYSIFTFVVPFTSNMYQLMAVRMLGGWGMAAMAGSITTYITEYYPSRMRGKMTALLFGVGGGLGSSIGSAAVYLTIGLAWGWQWLFYTLGAGAIIVYILYVLFLPESARWLQIKGKWEDAEKILLKIESQIPPNLMEQYKRNLSEYRSRIPSVTEVKEKVGIRDILGPKYRRRTAVLWQYYFFCMGISYMLTMWLPTILIPVYGAGLGSTIVMVIFLGTFVGSMIAIPICEGIGRKNMMVIGLFLGGIMLIALGQVIQFVLLAIITGMLYELGGGLYVAQSYAYTQELYPTEVRATAFAYSTGIGRIGIAIFPVLFGVLIGVIGITWILGISGILVLLSAGTIAVFGISTKGKTLEEISK